MFGQDLAGVTKILIEKSNERLEEIYPHGIPQGVTDRFNRELVAAIYSDSIDDLFIYYLIEDEAYKLNMPIFIRGCARNSLLTYLLGHSIINPMKSHYYCSKCGHFEYIKNHYYAIDSADKRCPNCNANMDKMGFSFDERFVFGNKEKPKKFYVEYSVVDDFIPFAINRIKDSFNKINVDIGDVIRCAYNMEGESYDLAVGLVMLPPGKSLNEYPDRIVKLKDGDLAYNAMNMHEAEKQGLQTVILLSSSINNNIFKWQMETGKYFSQVVGKALLSFKWKKMLETSLMTIYEDEDEFVDDRKKEEKILSIFNPLTYYGMAEAKSASRNTWRDYDYYSYPDDITKKPFYSFDAFMHLLVRRGNDDENAYKAADFLRGESVGFSMEWFDLLCRNNIPEFIQTVCEEYNIISSQSHSLECIISFALEQYYRGLVGQ